MMLTSNIDKPAQPTTGHFGWDAFSRLSDRLAAALAGSGEAWLVTGLEGAGKTTLLEETLPRQDGPSPSIIRVSVRHNEHLDLAGFAAQAFGRPPSRDQITGHDLDRLTELLAQAALLVVDGAHAMRAEVARYIQFAWASAPQLQIAFAARHGFRDLIDRTEFAYLRSRLGPELTMPRLSDDEAQRYVEHRLRLVGASPDRLFAEGAIEALVREGQGLPGRLNKLQEVAIEIGILRTDSRVTPVSVLQASTQMSQTQREMTEAPPERVTFGRAPASQNALIVVPQPGLPARRKPQAAEPRRAEAAPIARRRLATLVPLALLSVVIVGGAFGITVWVRSADLAQDQQPTAPPGPVVAPAPAPEAASTVAPIAPPPPVAVAAEPAQGAPLTEPPRSPDPVQAAQPAPAAETAADETALAQARAEYFRQAAALGDAAAKRQLQAPPEAGPAPR